MKKLIVFLWVLGCVAVSHAQKIIQLEEAKVNFSPTANVIFEDYENGLFVVRENYANQFEENAIKFLQDNFDINGFIRENKENNFDEYLVTVKSSKGYLKATYDRNGGLVKTSQKFKNILLPHEIRQQVFASSKGGTMTKNEYIAKGKANFIDKEVYLVTIKNGKKKDKLKLYPTKMRVSVADVEN